MERLINVKNQMFIAFESVKIVVEILELFVLTLLFADVW